jgi:hypothetical protein
MNNKIIQDLEYLIVGYDIVNQTQLAEEYDNALKIRSKSLIIQICDQVAHFIRCKYIYFFFLTKKISR